MRHIEVHIKEKDKGSKDLSLLNLRDEVVNFLYKDTVAHSTKSDLRFYVLIYFASIQIGNKSFLELILDEAIPKFAKLNAAFASKTGYLRAREYRNMVHEYGLSELFEKDLFFVIAEAILNLQEIEQRFGSFYNGNNGLKEVMARVDSTYSPKLRKAFSIFRASKIQDDRIDDNGNSHDLSKSVYRTVRMRNSRNLDINLQKYTSIRKITSESPLDLTFIQHIDPQIIFDLWEKYQVASYMQSIWNSEVTRSLLLAVASNKIYDLIKPYLKWKTINGAINRKDKYRAKQEFEASKSKNSEVLDDLTLRLVDSVLKSNERLAEEIKLLHEQLNKKIDRPSTSQNDEEVKKLKKRIAQLENLEVEAKVTKDRDDTDGQ